MPYVFVEHVTDAKKGEPIGCYRNLKLEEICFCQGPELAKEDGNCLQSVCKMCPEDMHKLTIIDCLNHLLIM